jgi:hypothetical protein
MVGMSQSWDRSGPPAWRRAPAGDLARTAFALLLLWALCTLGWVVPNLADHNSSTTTLPLPSLLVGVVGLLVLLGALLVGLQSITVGERFRLVRGVVFATVLIGAVVSCLNLVGVQVSADSDRRAHAFAVCVVVAFVLVVARLLLGIRRAPHR